MTVTFHPRFAALLALLFACVFAQADDTQQLPDGILPLFQAVKQGDEKSVVFYMENYQEGAVNTEWNNGWMPLHVAVDEGHLAIAELLLDHGAPTDTHAGWYSTPLHIAASANDVKMVQLLIEKGADVNVRSKPLFAGDGDLALDRAEEYGYGIIIDILIEAGTVVPEDYDSGITPLHNAITQNDIEEVERLLAAGADVNARTNLSLTPLLLAVQQQNVDIVKMLIMHGADVEATHGDDETFLHAAAFYGNPDIVQIFLDGGADVNVRERYGNTPLHKTTFGDEVSAARLLLENGADVNAVGISGETALDMVYVVGDDNKGEMIALLQEYGGDKAPVWQKYRDLILSILRVMMS